MSAPEGKPEVALSEIAAAFRAQAQGARSSVGSPIYALLLERAAEEIDGAGSFARVFDGWHGRPVLDAVALRLMGAVHHEVLAGRAPALARYYPSAGGEFEPDAAWRAMRDFVAGNAVRLRPRLDQQVQTNEVRRCCALLPGFLRVARATDLPLRTLEIGASAGLNLGFDRYRYELGDTARFGAPDAALVLDCDWRGPPPDTAAPLRVSSRLGCDLSPIDVTQPEQRLRLLSFVWPDHLVRLARLRAALAIAAENPPDIAKQRAGDFVAHHLAEPHEGVATVLYQSVVWWYLPEEERERVTALVEQAGARATQRAPLAWLRMEGASFEFAEVRLRSWPGGRDELIATTHWHAEWVEGT